MGILVVGTDPALTNDFTLPPLVVADLYQQRRQVELFFKWIKQERKST